jgi:hypothetical protein
VCGTLMLLLQQSDGGFPRSIDEFLGRWDGALTREVIVPRSRLAGLAVPTPSHERARPARTRPPARPTDRPTPHPPPQGWFAPLLVLLVGPLLGLLGTCLMRRWLLWGYCLILVACIGVRLALSFEAGRCAEPWAALPSPPHRGTVALPCTSVAPAAVAPSGSVATLGAEVPPFNNSQVPQFNNSRVHQLSSSRVPRRSMKLSLPHRRNGAPLAADLRVWS